MNLPVTPSLTRLMSAYLAGNRTVAWPLYWNEQRPCACGGRARGYRNEAGEFASEPLPRVGNVPGQIDTVALQQAGFLWWFCPSCGGHGALTVYVLPLDVPAALAIARDRLRELGEIGRLVDFMSPEVVRFHLMNHDPELKGASDVRS